MSYETIIAFRASDAMRVALDQLAEERETDIGKILRVLVARELGIVRDPLADLREQMLFAAIALDGLLAANPDASLRPRIIKIWQDRLAGETPHVA